MPDDAIFALFLLALTLFVVAVAVPSVRREIHERRHFRRLEKRMREMGYH